MVKAQVFRVARIFEGEIKDDDLVLEEEELREIEDGEFLVETLYLSVDPYMKAYAPNYKIGQVMIGIQIAKVIESKNRDFKVGEIIVANLGWRTHSIVDRTIDFLYKIPDTGSLSQSSALGIFGQPGATAYFGLLEICKPKQGDTVVVSGAAGAVGSLVGQIAKINGCKVVGITGSAEKAVWLKSIGFNAAINYKTTKNLAAELKSVAPEGIDCYFDNVGGETSSTVMQLMNQGGRVAVCGAISCYDASTPIKANIVQPAIIQKSLRVQGFIITEFKDRWFEAFNQNLEWLEEKKLKYKETTTDGFENAVDALKGVLKGKNTGKAVVRVKATLVESESLDFEHALSKFKNL